MAVRVAALSQFACWNPMEFPYDTSMHNPIDALAVTLLPILFGTAVAPPSEHLPPAGGAPASEAEAH